VSSNRLIQLFDIQYPIIQAGMIWCSGSELATAVSLSGGLGVLGSGSMYPEQLLEEIRTTKAALNGKPFAVNVPLLYPNIEEHMAIIQQEEVPIIITSAGNPKTWTAVLKSKGIKVVHVIANTKFAKKCEEAGVDALVAEGFEAGGHNGREETTTICLIPLIRKATSLPLIAAGGIGSGRAMLAAMALGAEGVQIGSRFVASTESSGHQAFKDAVVKAEEGDTLLSLKVLTPVRLLRNPFFDKVVEAEGRAASVTELTEILGRGRAKKGMYLGDLEEGELEIGQVSAGIKEIKPAKEIIEEILSEYEQARKELADGRFSFE
jgi:enoyl-[acyl-carrier protein] reductase II